MLQVSNTPNYAGIKVTGDFHDFDQLYDALHKIVGDEDENPAYFNARLHVLSLCYDLRHANMGGRDYVYVNHGIDSETMKWMGIVGSEKNLYLSFDSYYPETLFIVMTLNDFISIYKSKKKHPDWDLNIATVRKFQASVIENLRETLPPQTFTVMLKNMNNEWNHFDNYFTQYLDQLNIRFLKWNKEKRLKNISIMAKRIAEQGTEYQKAKRQILEVAEEEGIHPNQIQYYEKYPDEIDW